MAHPPGYQFVHNLPNKPLTGYRICKILKAMEMICKIFKTLELWLLWSFVRHKPGARGFCLYLAAIIPRSVKQSCGKEGSIRASMVKRHLGHPVLGGCQRWTT